MVEERINVIALANERMSIIEACNALGMDVFDFSVQSLKVYCPFGHLYHADGGSSKAMRIYPGTNSAWCFAGCGYFTPVKLIAMDRGITEVQAAESILEETNYVAPDYEARWKALTETTVTINTEDLTDALKVACARMAPDWEDRQFEDKVATKLRECLALLARLRTEEDARKWLSVSKQAMRQALGGQS